jgi:hypothetical protein
MKVLYLYSNSYCGGTDAMLRNVDLVLCRDCLVHFSTVKAPWRLGDLPRASLT